MKYNNIDCRTWRYYTPRQIVVKKLSLWIDMYIYRQMNTLKYGDIVYVCSANKKCSKLITTDPDARQPG